MSETKVVSRGIAIALGLLSILLVVGLGGAIIYYTGVVAGRDNTIQTLTGEKTQLGGWLDGNMSLLQAALIERASIETKLDNPKSGLPGIQSNFTSVLALLRALNSSQTKPPLIVKVIAEDDPIRATGIMVLGILPPGQPSGPYYQRGTDLIAHYMITVTYNGIPVQPTALFMQVVRKTVVNPSDTTKQFPEEIIASTPTDASDEFIVVFRRVTPGVFEADVYYVGPGTRDDVANYMVVFTAYTTIGRSTLFGTDLQALCVLGWSMDPVATLFMTLPDGSTYYGWGNPLGAFTSCDEAVLWQRYWLGIPVPQGYPD
jgi:hypothetical protein